MTRIAIALLAAALCAPAAAQQDGHSAHHGAAGAQAQAADALSEGEVRKVDTAAGKLTIKHGPLVNLDMPPMTMVFRVRDPSVLEQVKAGDKVQFMVEKIDGQLTVTRIEKK